MTSIPIIADRVPTRLSGMLTKQGINSANAQLLRSQIQLSTGKRVLRASDDPIAATLINVLDQRLLAADQRSRNLQHASSVLGTLDQSLEHLNEALQEARTIASSQVGVGSDTATRRSQAVVVQSLIDGVLNTLNRDYAGLHLFAGERTGTRPFEQFFGGVRYLGAGEGLRTDLGPGIAFPINIAGETAAGALSARHRGSVDLNPALTGQTRIADLRGPGGPGAALGSLFITIDDGVTPATISVDLSHAETIADVSAAIESAVRAADPAALTGAFPSSVGPSGERLAVGGIAVGYTISFADGPSGRTAEALGLAGFNFTDAAPVNPASDAALNPVLTERTTLASLNPAQPLAFGTILFENGGRSGSVTTAPGMTIGELREAVARLNIGVRVEIDPSGDSINVINEVSGFTMSVGESGSLAATTLGIRTLAASTPLSAFNHGRGVAISHGHIHPTTGLPDPARNTDFRVTLASGATFEVDLEPADLASVQALLDRINAAAASAGLGGDFSAGLAAQGNGIEFRDTSAGPGSLTVTSLNGYAAADLGLLDGAFTAGPPGSLISADRARVRVDSILTALMDLRTALENDDTLGITFAGEMLEAGSETAIRARSLIGARAGRIDSAQQRLEDTSLLDQTIRSNLQDLDYVEAATRFTLLQTQLQAGLQSAAAIRSLNLFSFLG